MKNYVIYLVVIAGAVILGCTNPFAPALKEGDDIGLVLSDQMTVDGVFQNWRYAYILKDTLVYGRLLANDFYFSYTDFEDDVPIEKRLVRQEDMIVTNRLFNNTGNIDLVWNDAILAIGDSLEQTISRVFNLQVFFDATSSERIQGRATVNLKRATTADIWKMTSWIDESNIQ
ncbi:MAG: hypothetical protein Kapaf2KO_15630 [Candidatus Kapaibacteriales bacterium]